MPLTLFCPACGTPIPGLPENAWGRDQSCPKCGAVFRASPPPRVPAGGLQAVCRDCGAHYGNIPSRHAGREATCKKCGQRVRITSADSTSSPDTGVCAAAAADPPADWKTGQVVAGLYEIKGVLGRGGMGIVHRAHHRTWGLDLAVKSPRPRILERSGGVANFEREAETWVTLPLHPHIVSCYYVRRIDGVPRVFAEYVDGGSLQQWIDSGRLYTGGHKAAAARIIDVATQFAWGLDFAHRQRLIHQDVKPANLMMTRDGLAKVTDFGLVRARPLPGGSGQGPADTVMVARAGMTPAFASPEQISGSPLTRRTDLWSWAVSVLEMFVGEVRWQVGAAAPEALGLYRSSGPDHPRLPPMPAAVGALLDRCLQTDPQKRPRDMAAVAGRLAAIYQEVTGQAYPRRLPAAGQVNAGGLNNRALSLLDLDRGPEARQLLDKAIAAEPHHPEATYNRGLLRWRAGEISDTDLVKELEEVRSSHPDTWRDDYYLARVQMERGDFDSAWSILTAIEDSQTGRPEFAAALALCRRMAADTRAQTMLLPGTAVDVTDPAAFSTGGQFIAVGVNRQRAVKVHASDSGERLARLAGHPHRILAVAVDPTGKAVLTGCSDLTARLWDAQSGLCLWNAPMSGETAADDRLGVNAVAFSHDGALLVAGGTGQWVSRYRLNGGQWTDRFSDPGFAPSALAAGGDPFRLVVGGHDGQAAVMDCDGKLLSSLTPPSTRAIAAVALSRGGRVAAVGGLDEHLRCWDADRGQWMWDRWAHKYRVSCCAVSGDGRLVVSGGWAGGVKLWEVDTGRCLRTFDPEPAEGETVAVALVQDDGPTEGPTTVLALAVPNQLHRLGFKSIPAPLLPSRILASEAVIQAAEIHRQRMHRVEHAMARGDWAAALKELAAARQLPGLSRSKAILRRKGELALRLPRTGLAGGWQMWRSEAHDANIRAVAVTPDGRRVVTAANRNVHTQTPNLKIWRTDSGRSDGVCEGPSRAITDARFTSIGRQILVAEVCAPLSVWDLDTGQRCGAFGRDDALCGQVAVSPEARFLYGVCDREGTVGMWHRESGVKINAFAPPELPVTALALSQDGRRLATCGDGWIVVWDPGSGEMISRFEALAHQMAFSADGRRLVAADYSRRLAIIRWRSGELEREIPITSGFQSFCLTADERFACIGGGSSDPSVQIWDLEQGALLRRFEGHTEAVGALALSPSGRHLYSAGWDGCLIKWALDWDLGLPPAADWDAAADPLLDLFLTVRSLSCDPLETPPDLTPQRLHDHFSALGRPVWNKAEFQTLLTTLQSAGLGWLKPQAVSRRAAEMAAKWHDRGG
jgi:WD40 repeat protein/serine/threonine protein kinase